MTKHWFWLLLTMVALVWYSTVTVYVAIRGTFDIRQMLRRLRDRDKGSHPPGSSD